MLRIKRYLQKTMSSQFLNLKYKILKLKLKSKIALLEPFIDSQFYLKEYNDLENIDPTIHYLTQGWKEGRNPNLQFDTNYYLSRNPDLLHRNINPLLHYIQIGKAEGQFTNSTEEETHLEIQKIKPFFDEDYYLTTYLDVKNANTDPLLHYYDIGWKEGRNPSPQFDTNYYLSRNLDLLQRNINPLVHYIQVGKAEGQFANSSEEETHLEIQKIKPFFDEDYYLTNYLDIKNANLDPLLHYLTQGWKEGRNPSPQFDTNYYLSHNPGLLQRNINPLIHYIQTGKAEGQFTSFIDMYHNWVKEYNRQIDIDKVREAQKQLKIRPLISVVMPVFNPPPQWLKIAIESVINQTYENWQLCIADDNSSDVKVKELLNYYCRLDSRINVVFRNTNGHISEASNSAIELVKGEFIALLDHDDELPAYALYKVVECINQNPDVNLIYSDEDRINQDNERYDPYFKPDWNYHLFLSQNMICHLGVYRTSIVKKIGGFTVGLEGSQDYDLALRFIEQINPSQIVHIPHILYHWRAIKGSVALSHNEKTYPYEAARKSIRNHLSRTNKLAIVSSTSQEVNTFQRVQYKLPDNIPMATLLIVSLGEPEQLYRSLESVFATTSYSNLEVAVLCDFKTISEWGKVGVSIKNNLNPVNILCFEYDRCSSYGVNLNSVIANLKGQIFCLLHTKVLPTSKGWLTEMVAIGLQDTVGMVGPKLIYPNGTIAHAGLHLKENGRYSSLHHHFDKLSMGYCSRLILMHEVGALGGNLFVINKNAFNQVGGFDVTNLKESCFDVDLALKLRKKSYKNIYTPYAEAYIETASESGTGDSFDIYKDINETDLNYLKDNYRDYFSFDDLSYNPNLDANYEDFRLLASPPRLMT